MSAERAELHAESLDALGGQLLEGLDELLAREISLLLDGPELEAWQTVELRDASLGLMRATLEHEIACLREGCVLPRSCPPATADGVRLALAVDAPVTVILQCCRAGHAALAEASLAATEDVVLRSRVSRFLFGYEKRCAHLIEELYNRESERSRRAGQAHLLELVGRVLRSTAESGTVEDLEWDMAAWHVGIVATGPHVDDSLERLRDRLASRLLHAAPDASTRWSWLGFGTDDAADVMSRVAGFVPLPGDQLCVGMPAQGVEGFRATHREALWCRRVARLTGRPVTVHDDVAAEALALTDLDAASHFVTQTLGLLTSANGRFGTLIATLEAYFAAGENAASAAARLDVYERTVTNRLRAAERHLGVRVSDHRLELELALRLRRLLDLLPSSRSP